MLLHGTGGDENDLISLGPILGPGWALLAPRGNVKEGSANRYFRRLAEGVFDVEDLKARAVELADFVVAASARVPLLQPVNPSAAAPRVTRRREGICFFMIQVGWE